MDIRAGKRYPASAITNFAPHKFLFDGVECSSMEGLLQSFKFENVEIQREVCKLVGLKAKYRGKKRNKAWKRVQSLWWDGKTYDRHGKEYQHLLNRAYVALLTNKKFRNALLATRDSVLTHSIGWNKSSETILTRTEFCKRLTRMRESIVKQRKT